MRARCRRSLRGEAQPHCCRTAGGDLQLVMGRRLRSHPLGVHGLVAPVYHIIGDAVLEVRDIVWIVEVEIGVIGRVLGEEKQRPPLARESVRAELSVARRNRADTRRPLNLLEERLRGWASKPRCPGVTKPEG